MGVRLYAPAAHAVQAADVDAPAMLPYWPTGQLVHRQVPLAKVLYEPAAHEVHTPPLLATQ